MGMMEWGGGGGGGHPPNNRAAPLLLTLTQHILPSSAAGLLPWVIINIH